MAKSPDDEWVVASDGFIGYAHLMDGNWTVCGIREEDVNRLADPAKYAKCEVCEWEEKHRSEVAGA